MTRTECASESWRWSDNAAGYEVYCSNYVNAEIPQAALCNEGSTDTASLNAACEAAFCTNAGRPGYEYQGKQGTTCVATAVPGSLVTNVPPALCRPISGGLGGKTALARCALSGRACLEELDPSGDTYCVTMNVKDETIATFPGFKCFDPTKTSAYEVCANGFQFYRAGADPMETGSGNIPNRFPYVKLDVGSVETNSLECAGSGTAEPLQPDETAYGVDTGNIATAGTPLGSLPINAQRGYIVIDSNCRFVGVDWVCTGTPAVSRMAIDVQDSAIAGVSVQDARLELLTPASFSATTIPAGAMQLELGGKVGGRWTQLQFVNEQPLAMTSTAGVVGIVGQIRVPAVSSDGTVSAVLLDLNVSASTSTPTCVGLTGTEKLMGFEDIGLWQSGQTTLARSSRVASQGCYAMDVLGSGYRLLSSTTFATPLAETSATLALDFYLPPDQPSPSWMGAVQIYATCVSANMNNAYIGQVELAGRPVDAYSTLVFPIPQPILSVLQSSHPDCFFSIGVNTNQTPTAPSLDNLRFLQ